MADAALDSVISQFVSKLPEQQAKAEQAITASENVSRETFANIRSLGKQRTATLDDFLKNRPQVPELPQPAPPPQAQPDDPIKNFGGMATLIGIFGGMLTRQPLVTSLNAAAAAMKSYHAKNIEDFDQNLKAWQTNTDYISKLMDWRLKAYQAALGGSEAEMSAKFQAIAAQSKDEAMLSQNAFAIAGQREKVLNDQLGTLTKWDETNSRIAETAQQHRETMRHNLEMEGISKQRAEGGTPAQRARQESAVKQTDNLISQADDLLAMIEANPSVVGGRGIIGGSIETMKGLVTPRGKTDQSYQQFDTALKAFQQEANLAISGSKYYSSARIAEMNKIIPGVTRFTSAQDARMALQQIKSILAGAKAEIPQNSRDALGDYTQEDLEFTAQKHGITVEELKKRLEGQ